jgi:hypothetical protein
VSEEITLRRVALVQSLGYNFFLCPSYWMRVLRCCFGLVVLGVWILEGTLSLWSFPRVRCFRADSSESSSVERCFLAGSSSELWKWHRKLGHLSFDLLSFLRKLNLVRGLLRLRHEKELVCAPCWHAKMVASSHPPLTNVMTERPCELIHMDLVGPARVRSAGGKWYVLVVVEDYSRYAWVFFLGERGDVWFCSRYCLEIEERETQRCHTSYP